MQQLPGHYISFGILATCFALLDRLVSVDSPVAATVVFQSQKSKGNPARICEPTNTARQKKTQAHICIPFAHKHAHAQIHACTRILHTHAHTHTHTQVRWAHTRKHTNPPPTHALTHPRTGVHADTHTRTGIQRLIAKTHTGTERKAFRTTPDHHTQNTHNTDRRAHKHAQNSVWIGRYIHAMRGRL